MDLFDQIIEDKEPPLNYTFTETEKEELYIPTSMNDIVFEEWFSTN